jgi:hypothetical protein
LTTTQRNDDWDYILLDSIYEEECIPFIGPDAYKTWITDDISSKLLDEFSYPLDKSHPLAKIAQFLAITKNPVYPKRQLSNYLREKKIPDFNVEKDSPYVVLAELDLPIYITTNYDHCMEYALENRGKKPRRDFCRWNERLMKDAKYKFPSLFDEGVNYVPSSAEPLVYHLHGDMEMPQSMVLTERDYLEFAINLNKEQDLYLPWPIRGGLSTSRLLFIGYDFEDITFRVLFQGINSIFDKDTKEEPIISVQAKQQQNQQSPSAQQYLSLYTKDLYNIETIENNFDDFVRDLRHNYDEYKKRRKPQ